MVVNLTSSYPNISFAFLYKIAAEGTFWASFPIPIACAPCNHIKSIRSNQANLFLVFPLFNQNFVLNNAVWKVYLAGKEKGSGDFIISKRSIVDGNLRSGWEVCENPRSSEMMILEREGSRCGIGEERGKGGKSERGRHCREGRRWRKRRRVAENSRKGIGMRMVKESLHSGI